MNDKKYRSATHYVLSGLIPYTEANLKLTFVPREFFNDLSKLQNIKPNTARNAYSRAIKQGLVSVSDHGSIKITDKGLRKIAPFSPKKLAGAQLMITFDIPESDRTKRSHLRNLLKELSFSQVQKSVWVSDYDYRALLRAEIDEYELHDYVQVFEARRI